jgi:uncharacterized protein (TIGR03067 family)
MSRILSTSSLFTLAGLALLAVGLAAQSDDAKGKAPAELQGAWKLTSLESNGESREIQGASEPRWVIKGDKVFYGGQEAARLSADASTSPRTFDLKFRDPERTYEGIYVLDKDTLKVCLNARSEAKDRPGAFSTKDQADWRLLVFERDKAPPANPAEGLAAFAGVQLRNDEDNNAVVVEGTIKGSPAEKAGLKKGDVILKVGATPATDLMTTVQTVRQSKPGAKLEFQVRRDGKEMAVTVTVGVFPLPFTIGLE